MSPIETINEQRSGRVDAPASWGSFLRLVASALAGVGGVAALLMVVGFVIVKSFLGRVRLYGLVEFPVQFYKEAVISYVGDIITSYSMYPYLIPLPLLIVLLPFAPIPKKTDGAIMRLFWNNCQFLAAVFISVVVIIALQMQEIMSHLDGGTALARGVEVLFYFVIVPLPVALFCYLPRIYKAIVAQGRLDTKQGIFIFYFLLLIVMIPIAYGTSFFDISLYQVTDVKLDNSYGASSITPKSGSRPLYLMGHTSGRDIFFDATNMPVRRILIEKELVKEISLYEDTGKQMTLKSLFRRAKTVSVADVLYEGVTNSQVVHKDFEEY